MSSLRDLLREAAVPRSRQLLAVVTGSAALGSAVGLSAIAAWLIARAAGMPSPADLALAAVVVRFFGIGRGLFRYLERLVSHDAALRGVAALRERIYERMAAAPTDRVLGLTRGDIMTRMGGDIDAVGDALVRGRFPIAVAVVVSAISISISAFLSPWAGVVMAAGIAIAGFGAAGLTWRAASIAAREAVIADARVATATLSSIEAASEHLVWGTRDEAAYELADANRASEQAQERAARPAALAAAVQTLGAGVAMVGSVAIAVTQSNAGMYGPTTAAMIALVPLAAFEAVGAVPAAVQQLFRSARAAERIVEVAPRETAHRLDDGSECAETPDALVGQDAVTVTAREVVVAWPGATPTPPVSFTVTPGSSVAIVGPSGVGKTTLLTTIAGALAPVSGETTVAGASAPHQLLGTAVAMTAEDAHLFGTTVLENVRVARGDVTEAEATEALTRVGLGTWVEGLPDGLDTMIGSGGNSVSGGERRRLLLARALVAPQPVQLIDEPAEHLDAEGRAAVAAVLTHLCAQGRSVVIVTHDMALAEHANQVVRLDAHI